MAVYQIGNSEYEIDDSITGSQLTDIINKLAQTHKEEIKPEYSTGLIRSINQGLMFGFADEVEAALNAGMTGLKGGDVGQAYGDYLNTIRGQRQQFAQENLATAIGAEILGSVGTGAVAGALGGVKLASKLPQAAGSFTRGAVVAAPAGALAGAGQADPDEEMNFLESMNERIRGAGTGALVGGVMGGALSKAAPLVASGVEKATAATRGAFVGAKSKALRQIGQAIERDSKSVESLMRTKALMGSEAGIADIGGQNTLELLDAIATQPGKAKDRVQRALLGRLKETRTRMKDSIRGLVHPQADNLDVAREQIELNLRTQARPFYDEAYRTPIQMTREIEDVLNRPKVQPLINKALQMARSDTDLAPELLEGLNPDSPNVVLLDYVKQAIDDLVMETKGNEKRIFRSAAEKLRNAVDEQVPSYRQARSIYGDEAGRLEALEMGQNVFKEAKKGVNIEKAFNSMTPEQKEMFRLGASNEMFRVMDNIPDTIEGRPGAALISKIYSSPAQKKTVDLLIENPQAARMFRRSIEAERKFFESANKVLGNSKTSRSLANQADQAVDVSLAADASSGNISGLLNAAKKLMSGKGPDEATRSQLGRLLTQTDPEDILATLRASQLQGNLLPESIRNALDMDTNRFARFMKNNPELVLDQLAITTGTLSGDAL